MLQNALKLFELGINTIPLQIASKTPVDNLRWSNYTIKKQKHQDVERLFSNHFGNHAAICGIASNNLVVLDCDSEKSFTEVKKLFPDTMTVKSSRGGHVYIRTPIPVQSKVFKTGMGNVEVRSTGSYVVAPHSIHPSGEVYTLENNNPIKVVELKEYGGWLSFDYSFPSPSISDTLNGDFLTRITEKHYPSRSERDMAIVAGLKRKGCTLDKVASILEGLTFDNKYKELSVRKGKSKADRWLSDTYNNASVSSPQENKSVKRLKWEASFCHYKVSSHYKVLLTLLDLHSICPNEFHLSVRECSLKSGISVNTALDTLKVFKNEGFLIPIKQRRGTLGNTYRMDLERVEKYIKDHTTIAKKPNVYDCLNEFKSGIFDRGEAGCFALQVYNILSSGPMKASEIAEVTGKSVQSVYNSLNRLIQHELISKSGKLYQKTIISPQEAGEKSGSVVKPIKRCYTFINDRKEFKLQLRELGETRQRLKEEALLRSLPQSPPR